MLLKTLELLGGWRIGDPIPEPCYDEAEIAGLGKLLSRLTWAPWPLRKRLQQSGVNLVPANLYMEVPTIEEIEQTMAHPPPPFDAVFDNDFLIRFLQEKLDRFADEFDPPVHSTSSTVFCWDNRMFSLSDAMAYYCMIRSVRPRKIVEVGSGWSTLVAIAALRRNGMGQIVCVEPHPQPFLRETAAATAEITLVEEAVQRLPFAFFDSHLTQGDIFFIDSTHTVKHGSDCLYLYLHILPALRPGLYIHAHDISLPNPLNLPYLRDQHIYWSEQYLLYAYLLKNYRTQVLFGTEYHYTHNRELLQRFMRERYREGGGSCWFWQAAEQA